uniref:exodeoxyribonuclease III n=1 Tax=Xenopus tropicalis TaxID=8364 RepID=A0A803K809_XENTR
MSQNLNIVSLNVRGLNSHRKRYMLQRLVKEDSIDLVCLQETHLNKEGSAKFKLYQFSSIYHSTLIRKKKAGVCVAVRDSSGIEVLDSYSSNDGRSVIISIKINSQIYTIVNLYAPNRNQISFLNKKIKKSENFSKGHQIIIGDLNAVVDPIIDCSSVRKSPPAVIRPTLLTYELYDAWRCLHPGEKDFKLHTEKEIFVLMPIIKNYLLFHVFKNHYYGGNN